jgi:phage head maturation protease
VAEDGGKGTFVAVVATNVYSRDGCVLEPRGGDLRQYARNPVVLWAHDYRGLPIGRSRKLGFADEGKTVRLVSRGELHRETGLSREVWALLSRGCLNATSVGFKVYRVRKLTPKEVGIKPKDKEADEEAGEINFRPSDVRYRILEWEFLEYSIVPVPADPAALVMGIRSLHEAGVSLPELEARLRAGGIEVPELVPREVRADMGGTYEVRAEDAPPESRPEETEDFVHIPVRAKGQFVPESFRTIAISKDQGISAVIGKLKTAPQGSTKIQKYLFAKAKGWTMAKAKDWVKKHRKSVNLCLDAWQEVEGREPADGEQFGWCETPADATGVLVPLEVEQESRVGATLSRKTKQALLGIAQGMNKSAQYLVRFVEANGKPEQEKPKDGPKDEPKKGVALLTGESLRTLVRDAAAREQGR